MPFARPESEAPTEFTVIIKAVRAQRIVALDLYLKTPGARTVLDNCAEARNSLDGRAAAQSTTQYDRPRVHPVEMDGLPSFADHDDPTLAESGDALKQAAVVVN